MPSLLLSAQRLHRRGYGLDEVYSSRKAMGASILSAESNRF